MAKKLIVGNWKMNPSSLGEAELLFKNIARVVKDAKNTDIVICLPFPFLSLAKKFKSKKISIGAQDVFYESSGAFTGAVSPSMLVSMGVKYVIVGHSERRAMGETDEIINKKLNAVLRARLTPILCVGESVRSHDASYLSVVKNQLTLCLEGISKSQIKNVVIAYEPVWALSSTIPRHDATPHDFEEMKIYIRKILSDKFGMTAARGVLIMYGGSANKDNALSFLQASADGLLPGKASLDAKNFGMIVKISSNIK